MARMQFIDDLRFTIDDSLACARCAGDAERMRSRSFGAWRRFSYDAAARFAEPYYRHVRFASLRALRGSCEALAERNFENYERAWL